MKKILFTTYSGYPTPNSGGPNKIIFEIIQNLDREKYQADFLSYDLFLEDIHPLSSKDSFQGKLSTKKKITNFLFENIPFYRTLTANSLYLKYHYKKRDKNFQKKIIGKRYDIIHAHDCLSLYHLLNLNAKKILTIHSKGSIVQDLMDGFYNQKYLMNNKTRLENMEIEAFNKADIVIFPSEAGKNLFLTGRENKLTNKYLQTIYNGIDLCYISQYKGNLNIFKKYGISDNYKLKILNVAKHITVKRIDILINVINELKKLYNKNIILICIGKGPETENLIKMVNSFNLSQNIRFIPYVEHNEILDFMKVCDFFVMPSERVVFDMVILEALATGICILANNEGGNKEIIKNGINGYLIENNNMKEILSKILSEEKLDKHTIVNSIQKFSLDNMVENYSQLYSTS